MEQMLGRSSDDVLPQPVRGGPNFTTEQRRTMDLSRKIFGWGSDLDPANRPGVPMDKAPFVGIETLYPDFEQQVPRAKVHKSTEHGKMTPVFGNACPPRGLSGLIRDVAYKFSEGRMAHWLLLVFADRVDVVEELLLDIARLQPPNIPREMGFGASLKYNRKGVMTKAAIVGVSAIALGLFLAARQKRGSRT